MKIKYREFQDIVENVFQSMLLFNPEINKQDIERTVENYILKEGNIIEPIDIIEEIKNLEKEFTISKD